jgi:hypothetical protein
MCTVHPTLYNTGITVAIVSFLLLSRMTTPMEVLVTDIDRPLQALQMTDKARVAGLVGTYPVSAAVIKGSESRKRMDRFHRAKLSAWSPFRRKSSDSEQAGPGKDNKLGYKLTKPSLEARNA